MTDGVALSYDTGVLRDGGAGLFEVAAIANSATQALQAAPLDPVLFGLTPGAPAFAAAVAAARAAHCLLYTSPSPRDS